MKLHPIAGSFFVLLSGVFAAPAHADGPYAAVPPTKRGAPPAGVSLRIVRYDGATNGLLEVEVKNTRDETAQFSARGLYFVPKGTRTRRRSALAPWARSA